MMIFLSNGNVEYPTGILIAVLTSLLSCFHCFRFFHTSLNVLVPPFTI